MADVSGNAAKAIASACGRMNAAEVSDLLLGRQDHALFVSMWACCFSEVERIADKTSVLNMLESPRAAEVLDAFLLEHGVPPCPRVLVRLLSL